MKGCGGGDGVVGQGGLMLGVRPAREKVLLNERCWQLSQGIDDACRKPSVKGGGDDGVARQGRWVDWFHL